jgi:hypothetical protein
VTTHWSSPIDEVNGAMRSGITEIAFFALSMNGIHVEEAKNAIDHEMKTICENVNIHGKGHGAAVGWGKLSVSQAPAQFHVFHPETDGTVSYSEG